jgi:alanine dehydrogenase
MELCVIGHSDVARLLPMETCIELMASALEALSKGEADLPLRQSMWLPERRGALVTMPAWIGKIGVTGLKVITYFAGNRGTPLDTHQGGVLLFDARDGRLLALVDATTITAIRTAAVTAVATKLLARPDATRLAILGAGTQARVHLESMLLARRFVRARVWSRTFDNAARFAAEASARHGLPVEASRSGAEAVEDADVICTTTSALEPVLFGEWLRPGVHVNAVGSSIPFARELDTAAIVKSRMFVDRRQSALAEAGDFIFPKNEGAIGDDHILGEIGDLLLGRIEGRSSAGDITLYKSLGLAIEDLAAAYHVYHQAMARGLGTIVDFGGTRADHATA